MTSKFVEEGSCFCFAVSIESKDTRGGWPEQVHTKRKLGATRTYQARWQHKLYNLEAILLMTLAGAKTQQHRLIQLQLPAKIGHAHTFQTCRVDACTEWHGLVHLMADIEVEVHSMIRSGQVVFSQSCTAMHDAHAHHSYGTYWLGTRVPIPPGRYVCQYNTMKPYLHLKVKSVTAPPLCCSETACCSRRWLSGNCFLVCGIFLLQSTWIWFRGHVGHEIRRFARRALRLIWNAMTKSMATKMFLMRWKRKRFLGQIVWLEGGCTCLSEPLFVLASRESRWGAMSGCHA